MTTYCFIIILTIYKINCNDQHNSTHRSFDHQLDLSVRHSDDHRHAFPCTSELEHVKYLVTFFTTHLHSHSSSLRLATLSQNAF